MRVTKWRTPRRKPFNPEGVTRGATVLHVWEGATRLTGQVWSQAPTEHGRKRWWVVTEDGHPHLCDEDELVPIGQCVDTPLSNSNAA